MAKALYMNDSYIKNWNAKVVSVTDDKYVVLDNTAFYPKGGGQPWDEGFIIKEIEKYKVIYVGKFSGNISHEVDKPGLKEGDEVSCELDWERRYTFMRYHTASHLISNILYKRANAKITGNQIELDKTRMSTFFRQERYLNFYNDKIKVLNYVDKLIQIVRDKAQFTYLFDSKSYFDGYYSEFEEKDEEFFSNVYYLLLNKYLNVINSKLVILSKELFDNKFFIFLGKNGIPSIKYIQSGRSYPINSLSGGEKSKLFLLLYGIINNLSNVRTFLLIDEPNELLDLNNVDLMKQLFFKLFKLKQLIICTFVEKYKSFKPALVYKIWKDRNHVSHAFQIDRDKEVFELYKQLDEIEKKIEQKPNDYYIIQKKLILLIKLNHYQEALDFYHSIKDLSIGVFDMDKLESYLKNIIKHEKEKEKSEEVATKYYRNRALIFYELKDLHQAIENADEALKLEKIPEFYDFKAHSLKVGDYSNIVNGSLD